MVGDLFFINFGDDFSSFSFGDSVFVLERVFGKFSLFGEVLAFF
jgi:hypothetical protein